MSGQPTPGPWVYECDEWGCAVRSDDLDMSIAYVDDQDEANARLIAAAPALLRAARRARSVLVGYDPPDEEGSLIIRQLENAIAKAEGRE